MKGRMKIIMISLFLSFFSILPALDMSIGNDTWSMGLSENDDDLLSWSASIMQPVNANLNIGARFLSFTDRGSLESNGCFSTSRMDYIGLDFKYTFTFVHDELPLAFSGQIGFGVSGSGNFGGETMQNLIHKIAGIYKVQIPYFLNSPEFSFSSLTRIEMRYDILPWMNLSGSILFSKDVLNTLKVDGKVTMKTSSVEEWLLLDWIVSGKNTRHLLNLYSESITGPGFGFGFDFGVFGFSYRTNLKTQRGFGRFHVNIENLGPSTYQKTTRTIRLAFTYFLGVDFSQIRTTWRFADHFSLVLDNLYSSGYPMHGNAVTSSYRIRRNYGIWSSGVMFRYGFMGIEPYAEMLLGVSHWTVDKMTNIDPERIEDNTRLYECWLPAASVSVGFTLLPEGFISIGPFTLRPDVFVGFVWLQGIDEVLSKDCMHENYESHILEALFGLGVEIGF